VKSPSVSKQITVGDFLSFVLSSFQLSVDCRPVELAWTTSDGTSVQWCRPTESNYKS